MLTIIKKDGTTEPWSFEKILNAVAKASDRVNEGFTKQDEEKLEDEIIIYLSNGYSKDVELETKDLHSIVIYCLKQIGKYNIAQAYQEFRDYKTTHAQEFGKLKDEADRILYLGDTENANFDSSLVSTKGSLIKGYLTKSLYKQFYLSKKEKELTKRGDIYIHDLRDMLMNSINCFAKETKFITSKGLFSFSDFKDGDVVEVPTHLGHWKKAVVRCFGKQKLNKIGLYRSRGKEKTIYATANHRWLLKDNKETSNLQVGDILCSTPRINEFEWNSLSKFAKSMWCLGFLYGDGTQSKASTCSIRLCGDKNKYANRFEECGFTITLPNNKGWCGDHLVWMHNTAKCLPPIEAMSTEDILSFVNGLLCADGGKDPRSEKRSFRDIVISNDKNDQIYSMLHTAGYYVSEITDLTPQETNFGCRKAGTKRYCLYESAQERTSWRVSSIEETDRYEDVWCLIVEDDHSFILEHGIPTGNCCLFDIGNLLKGGFNMSNIHYTEPKSVLSALQVIGDVTLCASAQQFGGFTLAELDKVLLPYCEKTFQRAFSKYLNICNMEYDEAYALALDDVKRELEQGFQSLELKLNTIPSSRGDFAFTTITFGQWDIMMDDRLRDYMYMIGETILETRRKGHSGTPVVFPKLVFLYDEHQIDQDPDSKELFNLAVKCSAECMYPDYLSLTGSPETNAVAKLYLNEGVITSPMGCRAYLTPWKDPEINKYITIGRCNIGAVSLNLPVIVAVAKEEAEKQKILGIDWKEYFWKVLDDRLETIREFLKKRYDIIRHTKASTNPLAFTEGGFHNGYLDPNDEIGDLVKYMTASFGITALNETSILWCGKTLNEDSSIANTIIDHINAKIEEFKKEDGYLYALYGTPAESLCHTQAVQYREYTGDNQFGEYFTNSFHLHVSSNISPIEKQDKEYVLFHKCNGGHIQYVRLDNPSNHRAVASLIVRGMDKGFYQGVNFDSVYCNECSEHSFNSSLHCPHCGSRNLTVISRVCGYLGYSKINGSTRMNEGKLAEIKDRVSM